MTVDFVAPVRSGLSQPLYLYIAGLAVIVLAAFAIGSFTSEELADTRVSACVMLVLSIGFAWLVLRSRGRKVRADARGITLDGLRGPQTLSWPEVKGVRRGPFRLAIYGEQDGKRVTLHFDGDPHQERQLVTSILERAPELAAIAWGLGLREERPEEAPAPDYVTVEDGVLQIEGPGETRIVVGQMDPDREAKVQVAQQRLVPWMLERQGT